MASILSIGNFDGLHLGHRKLLNHLTGLARDRGLRSIVITYDNHPAQILNPDVRPLVLMPAEQKKNGLLELGIEGVEMLHFDQALALTSADEFLHEYIIPRFDPSILVVGHDSHFGHRRQGSFSFLQEHASAYGYELHYIEPAMYGDKVVSSSLIRSLLLGGDVETANALLARPYALDGKVVRGTGIGSELGFPTANLKPSDPNQLVPKSGLYFCHAITGGARFFGLTIIGSSPTLKQSGNIEMETHIIDFDQQIYGGHLRVEFLQYLREEKLFESKSALQEAIRKDVARAREMIKAGL
ncbi:MAG: bifunctional riboflavin kinase/FAD synthetase [Candidatus Syntrophosphaera sp.]|nr:bifunctional riboflavin kinase/FAD synthetase [Candidatus Syntrophosphaera sp.]